MVQSGLYCVKLPAFVDQTIDIISVALHKQHPFSIQPYKKLRLASNGGEFKIF